MKLRYNITESPFQENNPTLGFVNIINGFPCPDGIPMEAAHAIYEFLENMKYVWLPRTKGMPEFDKLNPEHIRAAMASMDCVGYHAEEVKE